MAVGVLGKCQPNACKHTATYRTENTTVVIGWQLRLKGDNDFSGQPRWNGALMLAEFKDPHVLTL